MGGGDISNVVPLETAFSDVTASVDSFLKNLEQGANNCSIDHHHHHNDDDDEIYANEDEDENDNARIIEPAGAGSPLALALAATEASSTYVESPILEDNEDQALIPQNLLSILEENSVDDSTLSNNKNKNNEIITNNMADILGGKEIAQLLLQEHYRAEEVIEQMKIDRLTSEELANSFLNEDDLVDQLEKEVEQQEEEEEELNRNDQKNEIEIENENNNELSGCLVTEDIEESPQQQHQQQQRIDDGREEKEKCSDNPNNPNSQLLETENVFDQITKSNDLSNHYKTNKKPIVERGEIIIDFVWENERRGRWLSVLAVRATGGAREDNSCWVKVNEKVATARLSHHLSFY